MLPCHHSWCFHHLQLSMGGPRKCHALKNSHFAPPTLMDGPRFLLFLKKKSWTNTVFCGLLMIIYWLHNIWWYGAAACDWRYLPRCPPFRPWLEDHTAQVLQPCWCSSKRIHRRRPLRCPKQPDALCSASRCWEAASPHGLWNRLQHKGWNWGTCVLYCLLLLCYCLMLCTY